MGLLLKRFVKGYPFVYAIIDAAGLVKIGKSTNLNGRINDLQTANSQPLTLIWSAQGYSRLEKYLHNAFSDRNKRGEWFDLGADPRLT